MFWEICPVNFSSPAICRTVCKLVHSSEIREFCAWWNDLAKNTSTMANSKNHVIYYGANFCGIRKPKYIPNFSFIPCN